MDGGPDVKLNAPRHPGQHLKNPLQHLETSSSGSPNYKNCPSAFVRPSTPTASGREEVKGENRGGEGAATPAAEERGLRWDKGGCTGEW